MPTKAPSKAPRKRSVVKTPSYEVTPAGGLILSLASIADDFPAWGTDPVGLDLKLRTFWPTESYMQSAIYAIATRNAAFSWTLQGSDALVKICREMLIENWVEICYKWNIDYLTQNNGAFIEIIREADSPESPCIGINHLDSARCRRTGVPEWPVVYTDINGLQHKLAPHQVWAMSDMPSPIETMNGIGMCAVYRILREAERTRDISIHDREKLSGNNPKGLILVNNIGQKQLQDVIKEHKDRQTQQGYVRYTRPAIYASLDPAKPASAQIIDFASMPDGFNKDTELKWYITVLALALGCDFQDLAPLSSGNLGTSTQSQTLHLKSKGKGPAMYMKRFAHMMNFSGILPQTVEFEFDEKDVEDDIQQQNLSNAKATERQAYISSGVKSPLAVRTEMLGSGEITQEIFDLMAQEDIKKAQEEEARRQEQIAKLNSIKPNTSTEEDEAAPGGDIEGPETEDEGAAKARADYADKLRRRLEEGLAKDMAGALKKALAVLKDRILRETGEKAVQDIPEDPALWNEIRVLLQGAMISHIRDIALEAAGYKLDMGLGVNLDTVNQGILDFTRSYSNEWWGRLEEPTREGLRTALATWQESGLGKRGIPDLINALGDTLFSPTRAEVIAVTEVTRIFDEGNRMAERSIGIETQEWQTAMDDKVCTRPIEYNGVTYDGCAALDGKKFPIDEGPYPVTDTHPNCRCARLGVTKRGEVLGD